MTPDVLMLEDDPDRLARFRPTVARLGLTLMVWRTAPTMLADMPLWLPTARLIASTTTWNRKPPARIQAMVWTWPAGWAPSGRIARF